ncbi:MAG: Zn-dependent hydrolase [Planctomycetes bacterium]|nr:Zn-dependent hydrolase [Planctomycetota bacterium]
MQAIPLRSSLCACVTATVFLVTGSSAVFAQPKAPKPKVDLNRYATVRLTTDLTLLSKSEKKMIPLLIKAAEQMDELFWLEASGGFKKTIPTLAGSDLQTYAKFNYGPWDRLDGNSPFVKDVGPKPLGASFYPSDMTRATFEAYVKAHPKQAEALKSPYTMVTRDGAGKLVATRYAIAFSEQTQIASALLRQAAQHAEDPGLRMYLLLRAQALITDDYQPSDLAWMDMKSNTIDIVIGPIENYEDQLFGYKSAHEAYVLVKDKAWSSRLAHYAKLLPDLQRRLPVPIAYKKETPGTDSDLNAYDVIYYAGDCNAGSKTIAINLPNDEKVQLKKGTRRLQLKNAMRAKYDKILVPISKMLIAEDQRKHITFTAFFGNTMFHEVAHGLGIKNTINGKGTVRQALKDQASALEEGKADILGLYMVTRLFEDGVLTEGEVMDNYVTFLAGIFRSVRFGASSAHGRANMLRFNFFKEAGAFSRDPKSGTYRVNMNEMKTAMTDLTRLILQLQGDGNYKGTIDLMNKLGKIDAELQSDLDRLSRASIPVDVTFEQGLAVLGLESK